MADVTEADRAKARQVADEYWDLNALQDELAESIAVALAEEREKARAEVGRCGKQAPRVFADTEPPVCELPAGHGGYHREGSTRWGIRRADGEIE